MQCHLAAAHGAAGLSKGRGAGVPIAWRKQLLYTKLIQDDDHVDRILMDYINKKVEDDLIVTSELESGLIYVDIPPNGVEKRFCGLDVLFRCIHGKKFIPFLHDMNYINEVCMNVSTDTALASKTVDGNERYQCDDPKCRLHTGQNVWSTTNR